MKAIMRMFATKSKFEGPKDLYSIKKLSAAIAKKQMLATGVTGYGSYNAYMSFIAAPLFDIPWTGHAAFAAVGVILMIRTFVYESCAVSSMRLLEGGKTVEFRTTGLFSRKRVVEVKDLSARLDGKQVYVSAPNKGFYIINFSTPKRLSKYNEITMPDPLLLREVLEGGPAADAPTDPSTEPPTDPLTEAPSDTPKPPPSA